ncbi:oxidoreductase [Colletotrichum karsti]|uniref:Oxidoreductase n=1 Tax=Colletotrichum karsti TaxID=1095194 RepID=A0A9P6HX58_9PEZI|nr:oxidoreductase [Colletotrichum karsti]KAF9872478.1 oxidoreductase [Colletotrichum karsti]
MPRKNTLKVLGNAISRSISAANLPIGTFAVGGEVPIEPVNADSKAKDQKTSTRPIVIRWDAPSTSVSHSPTRVSFPVTSDSDAKGLEQLFKDSQPATFGKGGEHVFDESYRKAQKLAAEEFCTNFCPYETGIIDTVCQILLPSVRTAEDSRAIRAELYNMNIYSGPSGKFKPHVDTPRSSYQIGSLVVCLPMKHEGGNLAVRHRGQEKVFDWAEASDRHAIQWAAFYSDCEHEVFEVKSGHRVILTYNLYATRGNGFLAGQGSAISPLSLPLYNQIKALVTSDKFQNKQRLLGFYSAHAYPHTDKEHGLPFCLKGVDMALYEIFKSMGLKIHLCAIVEKPCRYDYGRPAPLDNGQFSDDEAKTSNKSKKKDYDSYDSDDTDDDDPDYDPDRVVGFVHETGSYQMGDGYGSYEEMFQDTLDTDNLSFDSDKIVWLNQNNGRTRLQVHYLTYGNEPSTAEAYSYFAMVVESPKKKGGARKPAEKRAR